MNNKSGNELGSTLVTERESGSVSRNLSLPKEIAKECFLFEARNYLVCGYPPIESTDHSFDYYDQDIRNSEGLYLGDSSALSICGNDNLFLRELLEKKYGICDPYFEERFESVNFHDSIEEYDKRLGWNLPSEMMEEIMKERPLVLQYLKERDEYLRRLEELEEPSETTLIDALKSGILTGKGFLVQKYDDNEKCFIDIDEDWAEKAVKKRVEMKTGAHHEYCRYDGNRIRREAIPKEYWKIENTDFEDSALSFNIGKEIYRYCFIILDFPKIYSLFPKELYFPIEAWRIGGRIFYDNESYADCTELNLKESRKIEEAISVAGTALGSIIEKEVRLLIEGGDENFKPQKVLLRIKAMQPLPDPIKKIDSTGITWIVPSTQEAKIMKIRRFQNAVKEYKDKILGEEKAKKSKENPVRLPSKKNIPDQFPPRK